MKKLLEWKTVLKGIMCLLVLTPIVQAAGLDAPGSFEHDAQWASLDSASQASGQIPQKSEKTQAKTTTVLSTPPGETSSVAYTGTEYMAMVPSSEMISGGNTINQFSTMVYSDTTQPDGLFLHQLNQSPQTTWGSRFLGPGHLFVNGYIDQGVRWGNASNFQPMGMNDSDGYQMNQLYLSLGRKVERGSQFSIGGQVDFMYGTDYYYMSAAGLETHPDNRAHWNRMTTDPMYRAGRAEYGFAMPQAYVEVYAPLMNGLDVKIGHFDSIMGYESLQANKNFFYSQSYTKLYGMPTSMTGVLGTLSLYNGWNIIMGGVNEWNAFDSTNDNFSGVVGLSKESDDHRRAFAATVMFGEQTSPAQQFQTVSDDEAMCVVFNTYGKFRIGERWNYVLEFTFGHDNREYDLLDEYWLKYGSHRGRSWFGLTNYLFYQVNEKLTAGMRFEWFNDANSTVIDGGYGYALQDKAANYFGLSFGANWTPYCWLTVRPEIRYDFSDFNVDGLKTYDEGKKDGLITVGADAIVRF